MLTIEPQAYLDLLDVQLKGVFTSKYTVGRNRAFRSPLNISEMHCDTSVHNFSMLSRDRRDQKMINSIENEQRRLRVQLEILHKDIDAQVIQPHKFVGKKQKTILTIDDLEEVQRNIEKMNDKLDKLEVQKNWSGTSVQEQAERIRTVLKRKKEKQRSQF